MNRDEFLVSVHPVSLSGINWNITSKLEKISPQSNLNDALGSEHSQSSFQAYLSFDIDGEIIIVSEESQHTTKKSKTLKKIPSQNLTNGRRNQIALWGSLPDVGLSSKKTFNTDDLGKNKTERSHTTSPSSVQFHISMVEDTNSLPHISSEGNSFNNMSFSSKVIKVNVGIMSDNRHFRIGTAEMVVTGEHFRGKIVDLPIRRNSQAGKNHKKPSLKQNKSSLLRRMIGHKIKNKNESEELTFSLTSNAVLRVRLDTMRRNEDMCSSLSGSLYNLNLDHETNEGSKVRGVLTEVEIKERENNMKSTGQAPGSTFQKEMENKTPRNVSSDSFLEEKITVEVDSLCNGGVEVFQTSSCNTILGSSVKQNSNIARKDQEFEHFSVDDSNNLDDVNQINSLVSSIDRSITSKKENIFTSKSSLSTVISTQTRSGAMAKLAFGICGYDSTNHPISPINTRSSSNEFSFDKLDQRDTIDEADSTRMRAVMSISSDDHSSFSETIDSSVNAQENNVSYDQNTLLSSHDFENLSADETSMSQNLESEGPLYPQQISVKKKSYLISNSGLSISPQKSEDTENYSESDNGDGSYVSSDFSSTSESSCTVDSLDEARRTLKRYADRVGVDVRDLVKEDFDEEKYSKKLLSQASIDEENIKSDDVRKINR